MEGIPNVGMPVPGKNSKDLSGLPSPNRNITYLHLDRSNLDREFGLYIEDILPATVGVVRSIAVIADEYTGIAVLEVIQTNQDISVPIDIGTCLCGIHGR